MKKTWVVAWKSLLELWREPLLSALLVLFPALMIGLYYIAFGFTNQGLSTMLRVLVINDDSGGLGEGLIAEMRNTSYEGKPVFEVTGLTDERRAAIALREGKAALLLVIPADFSNGLEVMEDAMSGSPPEVTFVGDLSSDYYTFAVSFLEDLIRRYAEKASGRPRAAEVAYEFVPGTGTMNDLQFGVPGLIVFGVTFLIISTATLLVRETSRRTLRRLRLTGTGPVPILAGIALAQIAIAALQIFIAWAAALAIGFRSSGSLYLGIFICFLLSGSAIGLGLMTACFARNDGEAVNIATGILVPLVFLSGAIFPMPPLPLATVAGQDVQAFDLLPTAHAAEALRRVLIFGDGASAVAYHLAALGVISAAIFMLGALSFQKMRLERNG